MSRELRNATVATEPALISGVDALAKFSNGMALVKKTVRMVKLTLDLSP